MRHLPSCVLCVGLLACMSNDQQWRDVRSSDKVMFSAPVELTPTSARGTDTDFSEWHGDDLIVRVDAGLFSDPLTRYQSKANVRQLDESIDGQRARVVTYDQPDGSRFTAAHFPDLQNAAGGARKLTIVVISSGDRTADDALQIVRSIRFHR